MWTLFFAGVLLGGGGGSGISTSLEFFIRPLWMPPLLRKPGELHASVLVCLSSEVVDSLQRWWLLADLFGTGVCCLEKCKLVLLCRITSLLQKNCFSWAGQCVDGSSRTLLIQVCGGVFWLTRCIRLSRSGEQACCWNSSMSPVIIFLQFTYFFRFTRW